MINSSLNKLNTSDIYSVLLFALFKIKDIPEYSSLSELIYILDKQSLLKLCEYFGGQTIKIPTIDDLEILVYCLIVYNEVELQHKDLEKTFKALPVESYLLKQIKEQYFTLKEILNNYDFTKR